MEYPKPDPKPKKLPKPLKRTPIKKKPYTLRKFTPKRARLEEQKHRMYESEASKRQPFCRGCGTTQNINHSHRITQNDQTQIANPENVDYYCQDVCHPNYESGRLWLLDNGNDVLEWLSETDWQRYASKVYKMIDRIADHELSQDDLPEWVAYHILKVTA